MTGVILVIPAYNEGASIGSVLKRAAGYVDKIVVVNDGSRDQTAEAAKSIGGNIIVLSHKINLGKGAALKTGCEAAVRLGADVIVMMDGDGQHPPEQIPAMVEKMRRNNWRAVFSVRGGGDAMPLIRRCGNNLINLTARLLFGLKTSDLWCGMRAVRADDLPLIQWQNSDYSGEVQMALKIARAGLNYGEHAIPAIYTDKFKGVMIIDGLRLLVQMIIWRTKF